MLWLSHNPNTGDTHSLKSRDALQSTSRGDYWGVPVPITCVCPVIHLVGWDNYVGCNHPLSCRALQFNRGHICFPDNPASRVLDTLPFPLTSLLSMILVSSSESVYLHRRFSYRAWAPGSRFRNFTPIVNSMHMLQAMMNSRVASCTQRSRPGQHYGVSSLRTLKSSCQAMQPAVDVPHLPTAGCSA